MNFRPSSQDSFPETTSKEVHHTKQIKSTVTTMDDLYLLRRTFQINNLKSDHKKIKNKESQTDQETQAKPFWFDMVDRVFGSRDEIELPFLFDSSKGGYENKRKATDQEEDEGHIDQLGNEDDVFALSTSKAAGKRKADREASNLERAPGKKLRKTARSEKAQKPDDESTSKELINVLDKQVKFLQEAQERDDKMMERMLELEDKSEERQKEILTAIINKL
ncbi:hypothetical protein ACROYT_G040631 [Oculina patagonica]